MSQALSSLSIPLPLSCKTTSNSRKPHRVRNNFIIKALAGEHRDNLDHLKRASAKHRQSQPGKRVAPVAPTGILPLNPSSLTKFSIFLNLSLFGILYTVFLNLFFRVMGSVSYCKNGAADDGDDGEGDGGPLYILRDMARTCADRNRWLQQRKNAMGDKRK